MSFSASGTEEAALPSSVAFSDALVPIPEPPRGRKSEQTGSPFAISIVATQRWMLGTSAVVAAATLFLASALSLGVMLSDLRVQFLSAGRAQLLMLETEALEGDLADAADAVRAAHGTADGPGLLRIEADNTAHHLKGLLELARHDPAAVTALSAVEPLLQAQLADLGKNRLSNQAGQALAAFHDHQNRMQSQRRAEADRQIWFLIATALMMALIGPGLGLVGITLLQRDRADRRARELQSELMHVQRLAVMGETAAMLAHEVSHPLTAAGNYLAALRRLAPKTGEDDRLDTLSERATQQINRAAAILHRLRRFIDKRETERTPVAPAMLIEDAISLLGPIENTLTLVRAVDLDLPSVVIDRVQIQQVLVNLIRNAAEAMQNATERRLTITAARAEQGWLLFSLADSGPGLAPEVAAKLFQPFISTKQDGMGVGLSICRSIIADHGGTIWAEPNPEGGTIFRFHLPTA